eukprot:COSAG05_NODE_1970_length_3768_cov_1.710548_6_plen_109_part_00
MSTHAALHAQIAPAALSRTGLLLLLLLLFLVFLLCLLLRLVKVGLLVLVLVLVLVLGGESRHSRVRLKAVCLNEPLGHSVPPFVAGYCVALAIALAYRPIHPAQLGLG